MRTINDLYKFKQHTRDSYRAQYGVDAPSYNSALPPKSWVDDAQPNGGVYKVWDGAGHLVTMTVNDAKHAAINLPGIHVYPVYTIDQVSGAVSQFDQNSAYNAWDLSTEDQARKLMADLGGTELTDAGVTSLGTVVYLAWEKRRMWQFKVNGTGPYNVGQLIRTKFRNGVYAPGHWDTSTGSVVWVSTQPTSEPIINGTPVPVPCNDLAPGEAFVQGIFGIWSISQSTDPQPSATGLTVAEHAALLQIVSDLQLIKTALHIQ